MSAQKSAARKIERAHALGWSRSMPPAWGPCRWLRASRDERQAVRRFMARPRVDNSWRPVVILKGRPLS